MSREEMMSLANENGNDHCYQDANVSSDRYVYNLLQGITLSEEAQAVLDKACELVRKTFKYRMMFDEDNENSIIGIAVGTRLRHLQRNTQRKTLRSSRSCTRSWQTKCCLWFMKLDF